MPLPAATPTKPHDRRAVVVLVALALITLGLLAIFGQILNPHLTFGGMDFLNLLYPQDHIVQKAYAGGRVPLWNWYTWGGSPLLAAMQSAALYPPMWLALLLPLPFALQLYTFVHLVVGGLGTALFARICLRLSAWPAAFAGVVYAGSGFFLGHIEQANSIAAMVWCPWLFLAVHQTIAGQWRGLWVALVTALGLLAGHPQHVILAWLFCAVYAVAVLFSIDAPVAVRARRFLTVFAMPAVAGALAAAQLLPTQELSSLSERIWPYPDPYEPALKWPHLAALIMPRYYNKLAGEPGQPIGYTELGLYAGIVTAVFALFGVVLAAVQRHRVLVIVIFVWLLAMLFALGPDGLVAPVAIKLFPPLAHMRGVARSLNAASFCYAVSAAYALHWLLARLPSQRQLLASAAVFTVVVADLALVHRPELTLLLVDADVIKSRTSLPAVTDAGPRLYRLMAHDSDFYLSHEPSAVMQRRLRLQPNLNMMEAVAVTDGYEEGLLPTRAYANFLRLYNRNLRSPTPDAALLALMGANIVLTEFPLQTAAKGWQQLDTTYAGSHAYIWWHTGHPSSWLLDAGALLPETAAQFPPQLFSRVRIGARTSVMNHPLINATAAQFDTATGATSIRSIELKRNELVATMAKTPPRLLFLQAPYPGWIVEDDNGNQWKLSALSPVASIATAPAGGAQQSSTLHFRYDPFSFRLGAFVSLLALLFTCASIKHRRTKVVDRQAV